MNERANVPALIVGGGVNAVVPQTLEEIWRLATMFVEAGLAPQSLVGREPRNNASPEEWKRWGKKGTSAVAIVIMSGAELGMPPMAALRSFTAINGNPALKGDGLINVVRSSGKAKYLHTGFIRDASPEALIKLGVDPDKVATMKTEDERSVGWCKAQRKDTGEEKIEVFSIANAKRAGLWDERTTVRRKKWNSEEWEDKPNDAPWFRFPERMPMWRAAGFCLRDLFADVLGGIRDEFEAREIDGEFERIDEPQGKISPPTPPSPPSPDAQDAKAEVQPPSPTSPDASRETADPSEIVSETGESTDAIEDGEPFDFGEFFENLQIGLAGAKSEDDVEQIWADMDVECTFQDDPESLELAEKIKTRRLTALHPLNGM